MHEVASSFEQLTRSLLGDVAKVVRSIIRPGVRVITRKNSRVEFELGA